MTQYKLNYFAMRGRGEAIRLLMTDAGQQFTDNRIDQKDWPVLKPQTPFGQLPYLEIHENGRVINLAQSITICKLLKIFIFSEN